MKDRSKTSKDKKPLLGIARGLRGLLGVWVCSSFRVGFLYILSSMVTDHSMAGIREVSNSVNSATDRWGCDGLVVTGLPLDLSGIASRIVVGCQSSNHMAAFGSESSAILIPDPTDQAGIDGVSRVIADDANLGGKESGRMLRLEYAIQYRGGHSPEVNSFVFDGVGSQIDRRQELRYSQAPLIEDKEDYLSIEKDVCLERSAPDEALPFELNELIAMAWCRHPALAAARRSVDAASQDLVASRRRGWPTFSTIIESGGNKTTSFPSRYLRFEYNLWDGGAVASAVEVSIRNRSLSQAKLLQEKKTIEIQVIEAWQAAQNAVGRLQVGQNLMLRLKDQEEMIGRRVGAGLSAQIEQQQVTAQILQVKLDTRRSSTNLALAVLKLTQLTGRPVDAKDIHSKAKLQDPDEFSPELRLLVQQDWRRIAASLDVVQAAQAEVALAKARIQARKAEQYPQIYIRFDHTLAGGERTGAFVGVKYTLGAGLPIAAEVEALVARAGVAEASRDVLKLDAEERLIRDVEEVQEAAQRHSVLKHAAASSLQVYESYTRQFIAGRKTWLDVLNAIKDLAQNEYAQVDARTGYAGLQARLQSMLRNELSNQYR